MAKVVPIRTIVNYQIKITLLNIKPLIWRSIIVDSAIKLPELHKVIQTVMGWTNSHLHHFIKDKVFYSEPDGESFLEITDYRKIKLNQVLLKENESMVYEYDFGDGWEHKIELKKILTEHKLKNPVCLDGKRNCPPEDCGGPHGYQHLLEVLSNPKDEEYEDLIEWLGDGYDPEYFDIDEVNEMLKEKDYGCITYDF